MRVITDTKVQICGNPTRFGQRYTRGRRASQHQSTDVAGGTVLNGLQVRRASWKCQKQKTPIVSTPILNCVPLVGVPFFRASSSSVDSSPKAGLFSRTWHFSVKTKLCTRAFLPLAFFLLLLGAVSFLWIPPRHARQPYSSLADDDYPSAAGISSHKEKSVGSAMDHTNDKKRRLLANGGNYNNRANFGSLIPGRCYDTGGPNLCSQANACARHTLLCKCTCVSKIEID